MKRTISKLSEHWDKLVSKFITYKFDKAEEELKEHFDFLAWTFNRVILPLIAFYVSLSLILNMNIFGSLFVSLIVFIYSNFLPDSDFLIKKTEDKSKASLWYERWTLLFFAPIIVYYILTSKAKPLYSRKSRCFHNFGTAIIYGVFLFIIGSIFWPETLKRVMLPMFGMSGFILHLLVDKGFHHLIRAKLSQKI